MNPTRIQHLALTLLLVFFVLPNLSEFPAPPIDVDTEIVLTESSTEAIREGNRLLQIAVILMLLVSFTVISPARILRHSSKHRLTTLYFIFLIISLLYSIDPYLTVRRLSLFGVILFFGFSLAQERSTTIDTLLRVFYRFGLIYTGITVLALIRSLLAGHAFFFSRFSVFGQGYTDAEILSFTLLLHWYFQSEQRLHMSKGMRAILWFLIPLGIILTLSRTAMVCLIAAGGVIILMRGGRIGRSISATILAILSVAIILAFTPRVILEGILRPETTATLTGRTVLWDFLIDFASVNPYWGAGFGAYWSDTNIFWVQQYQGWAAPAAHNGFLDVFLNTGFIGLALVLAILINAWRATKVFSGNTKILLRAMLVYVIVQNMTQGSFQSPRVFVEVMFWWLYIHMVETKLRAAKHQADASQAASLPLGFAS